MEPTTQPRPAQAPSETDLATAVQEILRASEEPLTVSKIRSQLPSALRSISVEELSSVLTRKVSAGVLSAYPKYRSQQDRFWDRPMPVHIQRLLRDALQQGPLPWSELRRKLPAYAQAHAEHVLDEQVKQGVLHRHPRLGRGGERFGLRPADPKDYLRQELVEVFGRLEQLGFTQAQLRESALELLHEEEWAVRPSAEQTSERVAPSEPREVPSHSGGSAPAQPAAARAASDSTPGLF